MRTEYIFFIQILALFSVHELSNANESSESRSSPNAEYKFYPVGLNINLKIKSRGNAHIYLSPEPFAKTPKYDLLIGGWANTKTGIGFYKNDMQEIRETDQLLDEDKFVPFNIKVINGKIEIIHRNKTLVNWIDPDPLEVAFIGFQTTKVAGNWKVKNIGGRMRNKPKMGMKNEIREKNIHQADTGPLWGPGSRGSVPKGSFIGGSDGGNLYVIKATHAKGVYPGILAPRNRKAYITYKNKVIAREYYEVLQRSNAKWLKVKNGRIPNNAVNAGYSDTHEPQFVCRTKVSNQGKQIPSFGVITRRDKMCSVPYEGIVEKHEKFEILVDIA